MIIDPFAFRALENFEPYEGQYFPRQEGQACLNFLTWTIEATVESGIETFGWRLPDAQTGCTERIFAISYIAIGILTLGVSILFAGGVFWVADRCVIWWNGPEDVAFRQGVERRLLAELLAPDEIATEVTEELQVESSPFALQSPEEIYQMLLNGLITSSQDIETAVHTVLKSVNLSFNDRYRLIQNTLKIFKEVNYTTRTEFFIPISIHGTDFSINVPFSLLSNSSTLKEQISDDGEEDITQPGIPVANQFTLEKYLECLPLLSERNDFSAYTKRRWVSLLEVADYLACAGPLLDKIQHDHPFRLTNSYVNSSYDDVYKRELSRTYAISIKQVHEVLCLCDHVGNPKILAPVLSFCISHYMRHKYLQFLETSTFSRDRLDFVSQSFFEAAARSLSALSNFDRIIRDMPIDLNLNYLRKFPEGDGSEIRLKGYQVHSIAPYIPYVAGLRIAGIKMYDGNQGSLWEKFPRIFKLDISDATDLDDRNIVVALPDGIMQQLTELRALGKSISLSLPQTTLPKLEFLAVEVDAQREVSLLASCPNLKTCIVLSSTALEQKHLSFLEHSKALETMDIQYSSDRAKLPSLANFPHLKALHLVDFAASDSNAAVLVPLNGSQKIEEIVLRSSAPHISILPPEDCPNLVLVEITGGAEVGVIDRTLLTQSIL